MAVHVHIQSPIHVHETLRGINSEEIVAKLKARVLPELSFPLRLAFSPLSNLRFAQEIVRRYNSAEKKNVALPMSCLEFLEQAAVMGFITIEPA